VGLFLKVNIAMCFRGVSTTTEMLLRSIFTFLEKFVIRQFSLQVKKSDFIMLLIQLMAVLNYMTNMCNCTF